MVDKDTQFNWTIIWIDKKSWSFADSLSGKKKKAKQIIYQFCLFHPIGQNPFRGFWLNMELVAKSSSRLEGVHIIYI